ncbi:hypothetical protein [Pelagicoccus sp. SDUM812003]|uniref:hypothetical protein n=1 Tax=Pelagicoccus sp. SDUM812003 TaxID=3041267 RepID=UPI00280F2F35|nr:hypothetical protein [Pelagicoccus sp. SDUM812003]MDQ8204048.1 hypothetical protein [Pelagicoccus sp. SDUM812003]
MSSAAVWPVEGRSCLKLGDLLAGGLGLGVLGFGGECFGWGFDSEVALDGLLGCCGVVGILILGAEVTDESAFFLGSAFVF